MGEAVRDRIHNEKIQGVIFDMSPVPHYRHSEICGRLYVKLFQGLEDSLCQVFMENIDYRFDPQSNDYVEPDLIICCDRGKLKGGCYFGTPQFIAEVISPSTVQRDRGIKKDIYERCGIEEYWIISPIECALEIYYLKNGRYVLESSYILETEEESEHYNLKQEITLRCFPISMTLEDIFKSKGQIST